MTGITRKERERLARENEIIAAAEKVFGFKGFDDASMDQIALEAQFAKRTLYLYFESKEELFLAAAYKSFKLLKDYMEKASANAKTGFEKLLEGSRGYSLFAMENPGIMRLIGEIGHVKRKVQTGSKRLDELMRLDSEMFKWVADTINEGKADGSIRPGLDSMKAAFSFVFIMTGFFNQLAVTGETFLGHFQLDPKEFTAYSMDLLFDSIKK